MIEAPTPKQFPEDEIANLIAPLTERITRTARKLTIGFVVMGIVAALVLVAVVRLGVTESIYLAIFVFGITGALPAYLTTMWTLSRRSIAPEILRRGVLSPYEIKSVRRQGDKQQVRFAWHDGPSHPSAMVVLGRDDSPTNMRLYVRPRHRWVGVVADGRLHVSFQNSEHGLARE